MFKFSIRDVLWVFLVLGIVLAFTVKTRKQNEEMDKLKAVTAHIDDTRDSLIWQLVSTAEIVKHAGFALTSDDDRVELIGPFPLYGRKRTLGVEISKLYSSPSKSGPFTNSVTKRGGLFDDPTEIIKKEIKRLNVLLAEIQKTK